MKEKGRRLLALLAAFWLALTLWPVSMVQAEEGTG